MQEHDLKVNASALGDLGLMRARPHVDRWSAALDTRRVRVRALVAAAWVAVAGASAVEASASASAFEPTNRIFTLAGGGTERPRDGLFATEVRLRPPPPYVEQAVTGLGDGTTAVVQDERVVLIGADGRLRVPPRIAYGRIDGIAADHDGELLALVYDRVYRLASDRRGWTLVVDLARVLTEEQRCWARGVAAVRDGIVVATKRGLWRIADDGSVRQIPVPAGGSPYALVSLPDDSLAFTYGNRATCGFGEPPNRLAVARPDGSVTELRRVKHPYYLGGGGLAALADGGVLDAAGVLRHFTADGRAVAQFGVRARLGIGDGGHLADALLTPSGVATLPGGAVAVLDEAPQGSADSPFDLPALRTGAGRLLTQAKFLDEVTLVRVAVPPGTDRPLVAVTPATYRLLRSGAVAFATTVAGRATLTVTRAGRPRRVLARVVSDVAAGDGTLRLPRAVPAEDLRVRLTVTRSDGASATSHLAVTTRRSLSMRRARRAAGIARVQGEAGDGVDRERCRRASAVRVDCQAVAFGSGGWRDCRGVISVILRPDGARVVTAGIETRERPQRRQCKELGRRSPAG